MSSEIRPGTVSRPCRARSKWVAAPITASSAVSACTVDWHLRSVSTGSVNTYSYGASSVLLPHVVGDVSLVMAGATAWPVIAEHTDLLVAFGGLSPKNSAVASGGIGRHTMGQALASAVARGCQLVSVSPLRGDTDISLGAEWIAPVPDTDAALMLALCHVLDSDGLADRRFLDRYTVGYPRFAGYVRGDADGVLKTPEWAAALTGIPAERMSAPRLLQGVNGIDSWIPVARIADMLLHPGGCYDYDGQRRRYPDVKLVYWCGGNPFHHHEDLARLRYAASEPSSPARSASLPPVRGLARPRRQNRRGEPHPLPAFRISALVIDPRHRYLHRARTGQHRPRLGGAVVDHHPAAGLGCLARRHSATRQRDPPLASDARFMPTSWYARQDSNPATAA